MALQIWLPLDGNIRNNGLLGDVQITTAPNYVEDSDRGKVFSTGRLKISKEQSETLLKPNEFSFACWYKPISSSGGCTLFGDAVTDASENNRYFSLYIYDTPLKLHWSWYNVDGPASIVVETIFTLNEWTHVAITYKDSTIRLYKNGNLIRTNTSTIKPRTTFFEKGLIEVVNSFARFSDYRVYNHCLSALEVSELSKGLYYHYPLNDPYIVGTNNLCLNNVWDESTSTWGWCACTSETVDVSSMGIPESVGTKVTTKNSGSTDWGGWCRTLSSPTVTAGDTYTYSLYIKSDIPITSIDNNILYIYQRDSSNKVITEKGYKQNIIYYGNGWYRCWGTVKILDNVSYVNLQSFDYVSTTHTYYLAAPQFEKGSVPTPYSRGNRSSEDYCYDCSGHINNINLIEETNPLVTSDTAKYSISYNFASVGQNISTREHIKPTKNISISAWVIATKLETVTEPNVDVDGINIYVNNAGIIHLVGTFGDLNSNVSCIDTWKYVVGTYDGSNVKLYVNGELKSAKVYTSDLKYIKGAAISSDSKSGISCKVSDFRVYATALSQEQIKDMYGTGAYVSNTGVLAAYELNE